MVLWEDRLIFATHRILEPSPAGSFLTDHDEFGAAALATARKFAVEEWPLPGRFPKVSTWARDTKRLFWLALADAEGCPVFVLNSPAEGGSDRKSENYAYALDPRTSAWLHLCRTAKTNSLERGGIVPGREDPSQILLSSRDLLLWKDEAGTLRFAPAELVVECGEQWVEAFQAVVSAAKKWERSDPAPDLLAWPADGSPDGDWILNDMEEEKTRLGERAPRYRIRGLAAPGRLPKRRQTRVTEVLRGVPLRTPAGPKLVLFLRHWVRTAAGAPRDSVVVLRDELSDRHTSAETGSR